MINYNYLRPLKAKEVQTWYTEKFKKKESLLSLSYDNATIYPLKKFPGDNILFGRGGVVDSSGIFVDASAIKTRVEGSYEYGCGAIEYKNEKVCYCGYLVPQWGHFLVEAVARLWYFLKNDKTIDKYIFFIEEGSNREISGNYKEFLELLGIWDKLEIINKPFKYREVVVPELGFCMGNYWTDEYKNIFYTVANAVSINKRNTSTEKVFFSRSALIAKPCKEFNMDMLDDFFEKNGYQIVFPEKETLSNLIRIIRNASEIATLSGSTQHNMLFADDNAKQIVLEKTAVTVDYIRDISRMKNLDTTLIDANLMVYPVNIGYGPFIMCYSGMLQKFAEDRGLLPADPRFEGTKRMRNILKHYFKVYRNNYQYRWYMEEWEAEAFSQSIWEAVNDGYRYFEPYLSGQHPFLIENYFNYRVMGRMIKHFIKHFAEKI